MKPFNPFVINSPYHSSYYSPKTTSPKFLYPSGADSRDINNQNQRSAYFMKDTFQKIPSGQLIKQKQKSGHEESQQDDNHSQVSMLLSQISVPSPQLPEYDANRLYQLENKITQHILELREEKITLMQELSKTIDIKNLYEHYLNQKFKDKDQKETNYGSRVQGSKKSPRSPEEEYVSTQVSAQILQRNEQLHLKLKQIQIKEQIFGPNLTVNQSDQAHNKKTLDQIMHFRQLNNKLKAEISQKLKPNNTNNANQNQQSRFVTFLPQDRQKHANTNPQAQLQELKERYAKLTALSRQPAFRLSEQQENYVESLRKQNKQLLNQVDQMLKRKSTSKVEQLRQRLQENQHEKVVFLGELQKFKNAMKALKQENEQLKNELNR